MLQRLLRHHRALVFAMLLFTLVFSRALSAQSDAGAGALRGEINEADGKAAANATVTVRNAETGYVRELQSNARGEFDAQALPVGRYFVQAVLGEFKSDEVEAIVTVGRTHTMALALKASNQDAGTKEVTVQTQTMVMTTDSPIDTHDVSSSSSVYLRSIISAYPGPFFP